MSSKMSSISMGTPLERDQRPPSENKSPQEILAGLETKGVARLSAVEQQTIGSAFEKQINNSRGFVRRQLRRTVLAEHFPTSLAMFPSQLAQQELTSEQEGKKVLVIEMGGTNRYAAIVEVKRDPTTKRLHPEVTHTAKQELSTRHFANSQAFFNEVGETAFKVLEQINEPVDHVGIIWSFPGTSETTAHGVDQVAPEQLPKDFSIPGISSEPVGKQLIAALKVAGKISDTSSIAVLNDTVGVLLVGEGKVGGVIGTGFNFAVQISGQIYNIEAGGFDGVPQTDLLKAIDSRSDSPGKQLAEKQIAGKYLGAQLQTVAQWLNQENGFPLPIHELRAEDVSNLVSEDPQKINETASLFGSITAEQREVLIGVAERLRDRSAQVAGTLLGTLIKKYPREFRGSEITIPIEGSVFTNMPGYQQKVADTVKEILGSNFKKSVRFVSVEQGGTKGAAVAALTVNK